MVENRAAVRVLRTQSAVVDVELAIRADHAQHVGVDGGEAHVVIEVFEENAFYQLDRVLAPLNHLLDVFLQVGYFFAIQRLVDTTRYRAGAVNALAGGQTYDFLAIFAQQHALFGNIRIVFDDPDNITVADIVIKTEQQVR